MPHVLVVGSGTLLDESMTGLLTSEAGLEVSHVVYRTESEFIQIIVRFQPEVVVISETAGFPTVEIVAVIDQHSTLPSCRIIVVQADSNTLRVCDRVVALHGEDLVRLVRSAIVIRRPFMNYPPQ